jgi:hypothetical protein
MVGAVYDRGYRPYDGERGGRGAARAALFRASVRRALGIRREEDADPVEAVEAVRTVSGVDAPDEVEEISLEDVEEPDDDDDEADTDL